MKYSLNKQKYIPVILIWNIDSNLPIEQFFFVNCKLKRSIYNISHFVNQTINALIIYVLSIML